MDLIEYTTSTGKTVYIESDVNLHGMTLASDSSELAKNSSQKLASALEAVAPAAEDLVESLSNLKRKPDELEIEFGLKISGEVGALIAKTSSEANFTIKLKWTKPSK